MTLGLCKKTEQEGDGFSLLHSKSLRKRNNKKTQSLAAISKRTKKKRVLRKLSSLTYVALMDSARIAVMTLD